MSQGRRGELTIEFRAFRREWIEGWVEVAVGKVKIPALSQRTRKNGALGPVIWLTLLFEFQARLVFFHEGLDLIGCAQQAVPLLVVESDGKTAEAVDADAALLADFEDQVAAAFLGFDFFFQLR